MEEGSSLNRPDLPVAEDPPQGYLAASGRKGPTVVIGLPVEMLASTEAGEQQGPRRRRLLRKFGEMCLEILRRGFCVA